MTFQPHNTVTQDLYRTQASVMSELLSLVQVKNSIAVHTKHGCKGDDNTAISRTELEQVISQ